MIKTSLSTVKRRWSSVYIFSFIITILILISVSMVLKIHPWGDNSFLIWDLRIQYVEYFTFLKNALSGNADFIYSFTKSLGGSYIGLFSYYLSSPLNLLIVFFPAEKITLFIYCISVLKLGLCALTGSIYFHNRFKAIPRSGVIILSLAFALSQYNISQLSNIMWIDGVILLPIILLGIYKYIACNHKSLFYVSICFSVVFNWYIAYMICLFSVLYYIYESVIYKDKLILKFNKNEIINFIKFGSVLGLGVALSSFIFYPTIIDMVNGKSISDEIFSFKVNGTFLDIFRGFLNGSPVNSRQPSFFCGILIVTLVIYYFSSKKFSAKNKLASAVLLAFMFLSCYISTLEIIWSGLRVTFSYFYRFSFLCIFALLIIAALSLEKVNWKEDFGLLSKSTGAYLLGILILDYIHPFERSKSILFTVALSIIYILILCMLRFNHKPKLYRLCSYLLVLCIIVELSANTYSIFGRLYTGDSNEKFVDYHTRQNEQVDTLQAYDTSEFYRIEQTANYGTGTNRLTAFYSENMAYNYYGISQYSSSHDAFVSKFISSLGYSDSVNITIYNEPILSSDSLLGIKYILSDFDVPGCEKVADLGQFNQKNTYFNPNALNLGFQVSSDVLNSISGENPFEYQNLIFSKMLGKDVQIYKKAENNLKLEDQKASYSFSPVSGNGLLYGYVRTKNSGLSLYVNGKYRCAYQQWLSYLVFNVGSVSEQNEIYFTGTDKNTYESCSEAEFYYLDLDLFNSIIKELQTKSMNVTKFSDGHIEGSYDADDDGYIMLSVPYNKNWTVLVNGQAVTPKKAFDTLTVIPVNKGENSISLSYSRPEILIGAVISSLSLAVFLVLNYKKRLDLNK